MFDNSAFNKGRPILSPLRDGNALEGDCGCQIKQSSHRQPEVDASANTRHSLDIEYRLEGETEFAFSINGLSYRAFRFTSYFIITNRRSFGFTSC